MRAIKTLAVLLTASACTGPDAIERQGEVLDRADARQAAISKWENVIQRDRNAMVRSAAARAVGRIRDPRLEMMLRRCLVLEEEEKVRLELLFALGQLGDRRSVDDILKQLDDKSGSIRARAVEALGKLGDQSTISALITYLQDSSPEVRAATLLALTRLRGRRAKLETPLEPRMEPVLVERIAVLLADENEGVRWRAAYALSEIELSGRPAHLRAAAGSNETLVQLFAIRGLASLKDADRATAEDFLPALQSANPHVAASAAAALGELGQRKGFSALMANAARNGNAADHHVRAAAVAALGRLGSSGSELESGEKQIAAMVIQGRLADPSVMVRRSAIAALARVLGAAAIPQIEVMLQSQSTLDRMSAAMATATLPLDRALPLVERIFRDQDPRVVTSGLEALQPHAKSAAQVVRPLALPHLQSVDTAVRTVALTLLRECGTKDDLPQLVKAYLAARGHENAELRIEAVRAVTSLASKDALEFLRNAFEDPSPCVSYAAADAIVSLGEARPWNQEWDYPESSVSVEAGRDFVIVAPNPAVILHTSKGDVMIELLREEAPRHVKSFLELARSGFYDGLLFHRVVSGFVVQGLEPRGDGMGTGGVFLRDEINPVPYLTGTVGMPNSGPDSGGCQIFITHVPRPHLDGRYTVFGRVIRGMDVVDAMDLGDQCLRVEILP